MNRFLALLLFRAMQDAVSGADSGGGGAAVADPAPAATSEPSAGSSEPPAATSDPASTGEPDAMSGLEEAMKGLFPADDPAQATQTPADGQPPAELAQFLSVSPYVDSAEKIPAAIAAANEVWDVVSGKVPAQNLFEGLRATNPQAFEAVMGSLIPYVEQITGKKLGDGPATPPDPNQSRLDALETRIRMEDEARQAQMYQQQVLSARAKATEFLSSKTKGTFAEGNEAFLLQQCAAKVNIPEQQMVEMLLQGKTDKLEAAYKQVLKEETTRLQMYNKKLVEQYRKQKNMVPATGTTGSSVQIGAKPGAPPPRKEGESAAEYATRLWKSGFAS